MSYTTVTYRLNDRQIAMLDIPIDNPYGGAAFGQKNKKSGLGDVITVVAGVAAIASGWGMVAAASWGTAAGSPRSGCAPGPCRRSRAPGSRRRTRR